MNQLFLTLNSTFPWGKYNGKLVGEVLGENPGYLLWLRQQRWENEPEGDADMSDDIHDLLDEYLADLSEAQQRKYGGTRRRRRPQPEVELGEQAKAQVTPSVLPESWGSW